MVLIEFNQEKNVVTSQQLFSLFITVEIVLTFFSHISVWIHSIEAFTHWSYLADTTTLFHKVGDLDLNPRDLQQAYTLHKNQIHYSTLINSISFYPRKQDFLYCLNCYRVPYNTNS
jgi:hypothetical protein